MQNPQVARMKAGDGIQAKPRSLAPGYFGNYSRLPIDSPTSLLPP